MRRPAIAGTLVAAALLLAGCTEVGASGRSAGLTDNVTEWSDPTSEPVVFSGPTVGGSTFSSKDQLGKVVVVNFWYAGCGPCRGEAADLDAVATKYAAKGVQFVGVNTSDTKDNAAGFVRDFTVPYPSVLDRAAGGSVQLAFTGSTPPSAVPSTLVLDRKGRVVARVVGAINRSVLGTLIDDALDGKAA